MKRTNDEFVIAFHGLALGIHEFEWQLGDTFFEKLNIEDAPLGSFDIKVILDKKSNLMEFDFEISGVIHHPCDRCLEEVNVPIDSTHKLIVKFGMETKEMTDEILILNEQTHEINISQYIYEFISLSIPGRIVHENNQCDKNIIGHIMDIQSDTDDSELDPRWDKLKEIKNKNLK